MDDRLIWLPAAMRDIAQAVLEIEPLAGTCNIDQVLRHVSECAALSLAEQAMFRAARKAFNRAAVGGVDWPGVWEMARREWNMPRRPLVLAVAKDCLEGEMTVDRLRLAIPSLPECILWFLLEATDASVRAAAAFQLYMLGCITEHLPPELR